MGNAIAVNITNPSQINWDLVTTDTSKSHYGPNSLWTIANLLKIPNWTKMTDNEIVKILSTYKPLSSQKLEILPQRMTVEQLTTFLNKRDILTIRQSITDLNQIDWSKITKNPETPHYDAATLGYIITLLGIHLHHARPYTNDNWSKQF